MLLLIDAGNTRIKWALANELDGATSAADKLAGLGSWSRFGVVTHADFATLTQAFQGQAVTRALVSNVAGAAIRTQLENFLRQGAGLAADRIEWFRSSAEAGGLRNRYRDPGQLGCDRFASAIGAHALCPDQPLIVATCGTATTIDAVSADGVFLGGMILPGLGLMATALARNTAELPQIGQQIAVPAVFADNTDDAIVSGCLAAQAGAIERAVKAHPALQELDKIKRLPVGEDAAPDVQCIISGGAGAMIAPHLAIPCRLLDNLVLIGLHAVALQRNSSC